MMANDSMARLPPLTFFQGQVVDDLGERHARFDLRETTLQPLINIARVLALHDGLIGGQPTRRRFRQSAAVRGGEIWILEEGGDAFSAAFRLHASTLGSGLTLDTSCPSPRDVIC
ncbi:MAG: putative nucleotidyltransferase substrate binding domain-containing protein [Pseudomonadota bacterium]|nr:putative nucleotidyltransferase substrate binding domain-containing protein [Pseudomonadota bacterium]